MSSFTKEAKLGYFRLYATRDRLYVVGNCLISEAGRNFALASAPSSSVDSAHQDGPRDHSEASRYNEEVLEGGDEVSGKINGARHVRSASRVLLERFRLLRIEKARSKELVSDSVHIKSLMYEDPSLYTREELEAVLQRIANGSKSIGGVKRLKDVMAILGCVRFAKGYYLVVIPSRSEEGQIDGHVVYSAPKGVEIIPLFDEDAIAASDGRTKKKSTWSLFAGTQDPLTAMEEEFKSLFKLVDVSKAFYWSYTYDISISLQRNVAELILRRTHVDLMERGSTHLSDESKNAQEHFIWNAHMCEPFMEGLSRQYASIHRCPWVVTLIHGSFRQQRCSILSRSLTLTLVSRRSRFYAGTRYLKRGVNDDGFVANDVEIEQIVQDDMLLSSNQGSLSAYVQMRGSIPTFWSQETSVAQPKPPIKRHRFDPWYNATRKHFMDLMRRYGERVLVLNLVKQVERRKRETIVGTDFKHAIEIVNSTLPESRAIDYRAVDFTRLSKTDPSSLLLALDAIGRETLRKTSFFLAPASALRPGGTHESLGDFIFRSRASLSRQEAAIATRDFLKEGPRMASKVPMRWSTKKNQFVPMRLNSFAVALTPKRAAESESHDISEEDGNDDESRSNILIEEDEVLDMCQNAGKRTLIPAVPLTPKSVGSASDRFEMPSARESMAESVNFDPEEEESDVDDDDGVAYKQIIAARRSSKESASALPENLLGTKPSVQQQLIKRTDQGMRRDRIQHGILRANCIDCLDRTNLAQFLVGLQVLNEQLVSLGILNQEVRISTDSRTSAVLMEMYEEMGDRISLQYGGSDAHRKAGKIMSNAVSISRQKDFVTSLKRYYSNAFTDHAKQDAINVFLGLYRPEHHKKRRDSTDVSGDFYLHNKGVTYSPNFSLEPEVLQLGSWWKEPLADFNRNILAPIRALADHSAQTRARAQVEGKKSEKKIEDKDENDVEGLGSNDLQVTSFDELFSKSFFRPRELVPNSEKKPGEKSKQQQKQLERSTSTDSDHSEHSEISLPSSYRAMSAKAQLNAMNVAVRDIDLASETTTSAETEGAIRESDSPYYRYNKRVDIESRIRAFVEDMAQTNQAVNLAYVEQFRNPFSLYKEDVSPNGSVLGRAWNGEEHEKEFKEALADTSIDVDNGWGMRKLQAYSGGTSIAMHGPYKGYPRGVFAAVLEL